MFDRIFEHIGAFSYKYRKVICVFALILLVVCIILETQAVIAYTYAEDSIVTDVFPVNDTLVVIYENQDEEYVADIIKKLEENEHVLSIQAYSNTLGVKMTSGDLSSMFGIDKMFIDTLFYLHEHNMVSEEMTLVEFVDFIASDDFLNNEMVGGMIDEGSSKQLKQMQGIVHALDTNAKLTAEELAELIDMDVATVKTILFFSQFKTDSVRFIDFVETVSELTDTFSGIIPADYMNKLDMLDTMTEVVTSRKLLKPSDVVELFSTAVETEMFDETTVNMLFAMAQGYKTEGKTIALYDFFMFLSNNIMANEAFAGFFDESVAAQFEEAKVMMTDGYAQLVGPEHSRMVITLDYQPETEEINEFYSSLSEMLNTECRGKHYLVGENALSYEVSQTFDAEYTFISIITAISVLLVVCITFRKFSIPVILVCVIECSIFAMMSVMTLTNTPMFFVALILVQCILMGSMIDYAILLTTYYTEVRRTHALCDTLPEVMKRATHAILTSALIMIAVSFICGFFMEGQVASILTTLGIGSLCAIILVLFVLPSLLVTFDHIILRDSDVVR